MDDSWSNIVIRIKVYSPAGCLIKAPKESTTYYTYREGKRKNAEANRVFRAVKDFSVQVLTSQCVSNCFRITAPQTPTNYKSKIGAEYCSDVILRRRSIITQKAQKHCHACLQRKGLADTTHNMHIS